jgi:hypothetical protein
VQLSSASKYGYFFIKCMKIAAAYTVVDEIELLMLLSKQILIVYTTSTSVYNG